MAELERPEINISSIRVAGLGGLGMIAIVGLMAFEMPAIRAFALVSLAGGVLVGASVFAYHRWKRTDSPGRPTLI